MSYEAKIQDIEKEISNVKQEIQYLKTQITQLRGKPTVSVVGWIAHFNIILIVLYTF